MRQIANLFYGSSNLLTILNLTIHKKMMITKFRKNTSEEIISQPLTTEHISYKLSKALYFYSLERKHPECYFENDDSLISSIRVKVFYKMLDAIPHNIYT